MSHRSLLTWALLCAALCAQSTELRFNGVRGEILAPLGEAVRFDVSGPAGVPAFLVLNGIPGPTLLPSGNSIPIGFDGREAYPILGTPLDAIGQISLQITIPNLPVLIGARVFGAAATLDPAAPEGLAFSNGASLQVVREGADAGFDTAVLLGQSTTLDGRSGTVLDQPQWAILDGPDGHNALLQNASTLTPTFSTDLPGRYVLELQAGGAALLSADQVVVDAYEIAVAGNLEGSFQTAAFALTGTVSGPEIFNFSIDQSPVALDMSGGFNAGSQTATAIQTSYLLQVQTLQGQVLSQRLTVHNGTAIAVGALAQQATSLRLGGATLDGIEPILELALANIPLNTVLTAIPPVQVLNTAFFSATFGFTNATYDPAVDVDIFPSNGSIGLAITLNNLNISADLTGTLFFAPYAETATITATSVVISADILIGSNANNALEVTLQNQSAVLNGFQFTVTGALGAVGQIGLIRDAIRVTLETALSASLNLVPLALNPILGAIPLTFDLSAQGIPLALDFPLNAIGYDQNGLTLTVNLGVRSTSPAPPVVALQGVLTTPSAVPAFGLTTPNAMAAYDFALAVNDDLFNQVLAALTASGTLNIALDSATGLLGSPLNAGGLALILPGAGFESFDPAAVVRAQIFNRVAPVITVNPSTQSTRLSWFGAQLAFAVEDGANVIPVLDLGLDLTADLAITVDPVSGGFTITPTVATVSASYEGGLSSANGASVAAGLNAIAPILLQGLLAPLQGLQIPTLGNTGLLVDIAVPANVNDQIALYFDTP